MRNTHCLQCIYPEIAQYHAVICLQLQLSPAAASASEELPPDKLCLRSAIYVTSQLGQADPILPAAQFFRVRRVYSVTGYSNSVEFYGSVPLIGIYLE